MNRIVPFLSLALLAAASTLAAQSFSSSYTPSSSSSTLVAAEPTPEGSASQAPSPVENASVPMRPFSHIAVGAGLSPLGIGLEVSTNINEHFNIRGTGGVFKYNTAFTEEGITANGNLNLATAGVALDVYPFHAGFRISPGVLFYNQNQLTATTAVPGGTSFTLNDTTYYSATANPVTGATPVTGNAALGLNTNKAAFTITTGWGNTIPRKGGHWSFPVEIGVAFIGAPTLNVNLGGWACYDQAQTECANLADTTPGSIGAQVQSNLTTQVAKWTSDLNPLKTYPILSFGVAYSFHIR
jgi:hypothetical protein